MTVILSHFYLIVEYLEAKNMKRALQRTKTASHQFIGKICRNTENKQKTLTKSNREGSIWCKSPSIIQVYPLIISEKY